MTERDENIEDLLAEEQSLLTGPVGRSRAGDFVFAGIIGIVAIISSLMLGAANAIGALIIVGLFVSALAMRYVTLRDAPAVSVGVNVSKEQLKTLRRLRALLNALPQPVMLLDEDGVVELFNPACEKMFGPDVVGKHISSVVRAPIALEVLRTAQTTQAPDEEEFTTLGVTERTSLFYAAPLDEADPEEGQRMIVMLRDRTEQKKLERMRTDFVANASHELRTPLTSMLGFIETLQGHAKHDAGARDRFLSIMEQQAERMLRLVEDLIGLSAIELNEARPPEDKVDLNALACSVVETLQPMFDKEGGTLSHACDVEKVPMIGDRHELFRLMQNLVDNALKYGTSKEDGKARVELSVGTGLPPYWRDAQRTGDTPDQIAVRAGTSVERLVWIRVSDKGPGIERTDLPRLTERFYRVNPQLSRSKGGTGLGLAIVKHILQRHRGGLSIESVEGKGAAFTCIFPVATKPKASETKLDMRTERA